MIGVCRAGQWGTVALLSADPPRGRVRVAPLWPPPFLELEVRDVPVEGREVSIRVDADRRVDVEVDGESLDVEMVDPARAGAPADRI